MPQTDTVRQVDPTARERIDRSIGQFQALSGVTRDRQSQRDRLISCYL